MFNYDSGVVSSSFVWETPSGMGQTFTAMKPRQTTGTEQERQEILGKIDDYINARGITICDLKTTVPEYGPIITNLEQSGDKDQFICFPSREAWPRRADVRANIVRVLTNAGILQPVAEVPAAPATSEPVALTAEPALVGSLEASSHTDVLNKISTYLKSNELEICDLRSAIPAYGEIIDGLDSSEKYKRGPGEPRICYPSIEVWEADTRGVKTQIMEVLKENDVL